MTLIDIIGPTDATLKHQYIIIGMIAISIIVYTISIIIAMRALRKKSAEMKLMQQQHSAKIDVIRNDHSTTLEKIRVEMLKKEEERGRQWMESEKETLHVLNGVSMLLDLNEKIGRVESEKVSKTLDKIYEDVEKLTGMGVDSEVLAIIKKKVEVLAIIKEKVEVLGVIKEKVDVLDAIKEKVDVLDVIREKVEVLDVIKEKVEVLDVIKEKVEILDVLKEKLSLP